MYPRVRGRALPLLVRWRLVQFACDTHRGTTATGGTKTRSLYSAFSMTHRAWLRRDEAQRDPLQPAESLLT